MLPKAGFSNTRRANHENDQNKQTARSAVLVSAACIIAVIAHAAIPASSAANLTPATGIAAICQERSVPALAVVATQDGQSCDRAAAGVRKLGEPTPVTKNGMFHIGSRPEVQTEEKESRKLCALVLMTSAHERAAPQQK